MPPKELRSRELRKALCLAPRALSKPCYPLVVNSPALLAKQRRYSPVAVPAIFRRMLDYPLYQHGFIVRNRRLVTMCRSPLAKYPAVGRSDRWLAHTEAQPGFCRNEAGKATTTSYQRILRSSACSSSQGRQCSEIMSSYCSMVRNFVYIKVNSTTVIHNSINK